MKKDNYLIKKKYRKYKKYKDKKVYIKEEYESKLEHVFILAFNEKDLYKRYKLIYDYMCDYLDEISHRVCDFKCDKCIANRLKKSVHDTCGCCYFRKEGLCKYLVDKKCIRPNISCKLFMCEYIEKKYLKYKSLPKNYILLDFFFNKKQKSLLQRSFKIEKEILLTKLIELK